MRGEGLEGQVKVTTFRPSCVFIFLVIISISFRVGFGFGLVSSFILGFGFGFVIFHFTFRPFEAVAVDQVQKNHIS